MLQKLDDVTRDGFVAGHRHSRCQRNRTVPTDPPMVLTIYCDRQARDRRHPQKRWFVFASEGAK